MLRLKIRECGEVSLAPVFRQGRRCGLNHLYEFLRIGPCHRIGKSDGLLPVQKQRKQGGQEPGMDAHAGAHFTALPGRNEARKDSKAAHVQGSGKRQLARSEK